MTGAILKGTGRALVTFVGAALVFSLVFYAISWIVPRHDPLPTQLARQDEKAAAQAAQAIGQGVEGRNADATINIDLTTKEIRDAFDALPAPAPAAPDREPRALPHAPVDRLRDRLNQGIARANRAAGTPDAAD